METKLTSAPCWGAQHQRPRPVQPGGTPNWAAGPRERSAANESQQTRTSSRTGLLRKLKSSRSEPPFFDFQVLSTKKMKNVQSSPLPKTFAHGTARKCSSSFDRDVKREQREDAAISVCHSNASEVSELSGSNSSLIICCVVFMASQENSSSKLQAVTM